MGGETMEKVSLAPAELRQPGFGVVRRTSKRRFAALHAALCLLILGVVLNGTPAFSQQRPSAVPPTLTENASVVVSGSVVSTTGTTMIIRMSDGQHIVVVHDRNAPGTKDVAIGSQVRISARRDAEGILVAQSVNSDREPTGAGSPMSEPVPDEVRRLESDIARQAQRFRLGLRAGVGLDPETLAVGAHTKLGPFFHRDVYFRPNIEFGFGEVTTYGALNLEFVYRLPVTERQARYSIYVGAGPGLNFLDRNFKEDGTTNEGRDIDFNDFDFDASLNFLAGVEFRSGMFLELKSTAYSNPQTKIVVGYSF